MEDDDDGGGKVLNEGEAAARESEEAQALIYQCVRKMVSYVTTYVVQKHSYVEFCNLLAMNFSVIKMSLFNILVRVAPMENCS